MENIIYNELRYRGYQVDVGTVESREKDTDGKETTVKYYEYDTNFYAAVVEDKVYLVNKMNVKDLDEAYQKMVNPDTEDAEESTSDTATEEN